MAPDKLGSLEARVRSLVELIQNLKRENADLKGTLREAHTRLSREEELNHRWIKERVQIKTRITRVMHELDSLESAVGSKEVALDKDHRG
ncbi:MAG: cell division protein ZapB [Anaerolineales bacterium]